MSQLNERYDTSFYRDQIDGSIRSARLIIPCLLSFLPLTKSVVDVGCGTGAWLSVLDLGGIKDILGIDGGTSDESVSQISAEQRVQRDLEHSIHVPRRFDVCLSLEVAEHLSATRARSFVADLCRLSDRVLFGAAIPGQGGTHHINEQWASYWIMLFRKEGYECYDIIRPRFWSDTRIEWWYAQNTFLFIKTGEAPDSICPYRLSAESLSDVVHPRCFKQAVTENSKLKRLIAAQNPPPASESLGDSSSQLIADLRTHIAAVEATFSWRITAPLRTIRRLVSYFARTYFSR